MTKGKTVDKMIQLEQLGIASEAVTYALRWSLPIPSGVEEGVHYVPSMKERLSEIKKARDILNTLIVVNE